MSNKKNGRKSLCRKSGMDINKNVREMIKAIALDDLTFNSMYAYLQHYDDAEKYNIVETVAYLSLLPMEERGKLRKELGYEFEILMMFAALAEASIIKTGKYEPNLIGK